MRKSLLVFLTILFVAQMLAGCCPCWYGSGGRGYGYERDYNGQHGRIPRLQGTPLKRPAPYFPFSTGLILDVVLVGDVFTSLTGYQNRGYALIPLN